MSTTIKQPKTEKEFEAYYDLRWRVLREPWQQLKGSEKDELENESFHIMACDENNNIVGVGRELAVEAAEGRGLLVDKGYENIDSNEGLFG